jgi:hypothetical protein
MKRLILAAGALLLATANTPPTTSAGAMPGDELDSVVAAEAPAQGSDKADKPAKPAKAKPQRMAAAPADPSPAAYPRCSASVRDRCVQGRSSAPGRAASNDRRIQLAMRAGERG